MFSLLVSLCVQGCGSRTTSARGTAPLSTPTQSSSWTKLWPPKNNTRRYLRSSTSTLLCLCLFLLVVLSRELARCFSTACHGCLCLFACLCLFCLAILHMFVKCMHACAHRGISARTHTPTRAHHQGCSHTPSMELSSWDPGTTIPSSGALLFPWQQSRRRLSLSLDSILLHSLRLPTLSHCVWPHDCGGDAEPLQPRWWLQAFGITSVLPPSVDMIRNDALWQMNPRLSQPAVRH